MSGSTSNFALDFCASRICHRSIRVLVSGAVAARRQGEPDVLRLIRRRNHQDDESAAEMMASRGDRARYHRVRSRNFLAQVGAWSCSYLRPTLAPRAQNEHLRPTRRHKRLSTLAPRARRKMRCVTWVCCCCDQCTNTQRADVHCTTHRTSCDESVCRHCGRAREKVHEAVPVRCTTHWCGRTTISKTGTRQHPCERPGTRGADRRV